MYRKSIRVIAILIIWWMIVVVFSSIDLLRYGISGNGMPPWQPSIGWMNNHPSRWGRNVTIGWTRTRVLALFSNNTPTVVNDVDPGWLVRHGLAVHPIPWSYTVMAPNPPLPLNTFVMEDMVGWPMRMVGIRGIAIPPSASSVAEWVIWWPGIIINIVIGPIILYITLVTRRVYLEWRENYRHMCGQCVKCGYDRTGLAIVVACPECGYLRPTRTVHRDQRDMSQASHVKKLIR
jgi:hypothetical protein